jgi:hypothetical protein
MQPAKFCATPETDRERRRVVTALRRSNDERRCTQTCHGRETKFRRPSAVRIVLRQRVVVQLERMNRPNPLSSRAVNRGFIARGELRSKEMSKQVAGSGFRDSWILAALAGCGAYSNAAPVQEAKTAPSAQAQPAALVLPSPAAPPVSSEELEAAAAPSTAAPSTATKPHLMQVGRELLPGKKCSKAKLPTWEYESAEHRVRLVPDSFQVALPRGWLAAVDRPDLVVVSAPELSRGVHPTFELFVSPVCKDYTLEVVHERIAARGLLEFLPQESTATQMASGLGEGRWSAGLGGPVGRSLILYDVAIQTPDGDHVLVVYATELASSKTAGIHAAAVCPRELAPAEGMGACEKTYMEMLGSAH